MKVAWTSSRGFASSILAVAVVIIIVLSAYMAIEISGLQAQVSSLQDQNAALGNQVGQLQNQQNNLQSQLQGLLTTSTQKPFSFDVQNLCVSVTSQCYGGRFVYAMEIVNNGTSPIPGSSSVSLEFRDNATGTVFVFNSSLPTDVSVGGVVYLNSTTWPQYTNATTKLTPGDVTLVLVSVGNTQVEAETEVLMCSGSGTTTVTCGTVTKSIFSTSSV